MSTRRPSRFPATLRDPKPSGAVSSRSDALEDYDRKVVYRHEQTLSKPKADRLNLLQTTRAHCELIFMVYSDPADEVGKLLLPERPCDRRDARRIRRLHRMWKVSDPATVAAAKAKMADKKLIIADGHHRYETAMNYRNQMREQAKSSDPDAPYEHVMMSFVNMDTPRLGNSADPSRRLRARGLQPLHESYAGDEVLRHRGPWPGQRRRRTLSQRLREAGRRPHRAARGHGATTPSC